LCQLNRGRSNVQNVDEECKYYKKGEPYINEEINLGADEGSYEPEEAEYFICKLPNLDSEIAKLKVRCQGDVNVCNNSGELSEIIISR